MRAMIELKQVSLQRGQKFLLDHADLRIHPGQHVGLIGANGSGKSSLFQMLLGNLAADTGHCLVRSQWRVAHMAQEIENTQDNRAPGGDAGHHFSHLSDRARSVM